MNGFEKAFGKVAAFLRKEGFKDAQTGIILGTGMSSVVDSFSIDRRVSFKDVPGLPASSVGFQSPSIISGRLGKEGVMASTGRFHFYEGHSMRTVASIVYVMHRMGVKRLFINSAVGGINEGYSPGDLILVKDHIYLCTDSPLIGLRDELGHMLFPNLIDAYDAGERERLGRLGKGMKEGILAFLPGPAFETRAELAFLKSLGADLIGWSMAPEVMMARALGMKVAAICCVSDISNPATVVKADLGEIVDVCKRAAPVYADFLTRALGA